MQHDGLPGFTFVKPEEEEEEEEVAMRRTSKKAQRAAAPKEEEEEVVVVKQTQKVQRSAMGFVKGLFSRKERLEVPGLLNAKQDACECTH